MIKYPIIPVNRIKQIRYRALIDMEDGRTIELSFTELENLHDRFESFKKQTGYRKI